MAYKDYGTSINKLKLDKKSLVNENLKTELFPNWVISKDFVNLFLPYLTIKTDSREQDKWISNACDYYGINHALAKKDKKNNVENLKEGDITFSITFGDNVYDYESKVAYERKGQPSEFYNNCTKDRKRVEEEFERQSVKDYDKFVLLLEFGDCLYDLIGYEFSYYNENAEKVTKNFRSTIYSTIVSWKNKNKYNFDVIQSDVYNQKTKIEKSKMRERLFWLMVLDMFYFFRQEMRLEYNKKSME